MYTPVLKAPSTAARMPTYQSVNRVRSDSNIGRTCLRGEHVAFSPDRSQQLARVPVVNLAPQALHVNLDQIGEGIEVLLPNMLGNLSPTNDLIDMARQVIQQGIFFCGKFDGALRARHTACSGVDHKVRDL